MNRFKRGESRVGGRGEVLLSVWDEVGEVQGQDVRCSFPSVPMLLSF